MMERATAAAGCFSTCEWAGAAGAHSRCDTAFRCSSGRGGGVVVVAVAVVVAVVAGDRASWRRGTR